MSAITILRSRQLADIDPTQSGFAHGFGVFETIKLSAGRLCFWDTHWQRLQGSADALALPLEMDAAEAFTAVCALAAEDDLVDATIKLSLLRERDGARLYVYARPPFPAPETASLWLDTTCPLNEYSPLAGHKTHNYMENILLLERSRREGFFDRIRLNTRGYLAETTTSNLFFIRDGQLLTPSLEVGILPGVVRQSILGAFEVTAGLYEPDVLKEADAVFLTNASVGIFPVERVCFAEGHVVELDGSHPQVAELTSRFAELQQAASRPLEKA